MEKSVIFTCGTEFHLLVSFILAAVHYPTSHKILLIEVNARTRDALERARSLAIWDEVIEILPDQQDTTYESLTQKIIDRAEVLHYFSFGYRCFNPLFSACAARKIPIILTDEGLFSYSPQRRYAAWLAQNPEKHAWLSAGYDASKISEIWLFAPVLYSELPFCEIRGISLEDFYSACRNNPRLVEYFHRLFGIDAGWDWPGKKVLYFRQYYAALGVIEQEVDSWFDRRICSLFDPDQIYIKDHPAHANPQYVQNPSLATGKVLPWEVMLMLPEIDPGIQIRLPEVYLSITSSAMFKTAIMGARGVFVFLHKLIEPYSTWQDRTIDGLIEKLRHLYPSLEFIIPQDWLELQEYALTWQSRYQLHVRDQALSPTDEIQLLQKLFLKYWQNDREKAVQLANRDHRIELLQHENSILQDHLHQHKETVQILNDRLYGIYHSTAWKYTQDLWSLRLWLVPMNSSREKFVKGILNFFRRLRAR